MKDQNQGRNNFPIKPKVNPQRFAQLINNQGTFARIMRSKTCPCVGANKGTPDLYCQLCFGEGLLYDYQREITITDDRCVVLENYSNKAYVYYVPMLKPIKFQLLSGKSQFGIVDLKILDFDSNSITVEGELRDEDRIRGSYIVDRYEFVENDITDVIPNTNILTVSKLTANDSYNTSNSIKAKGDITKIVKVYETENTNNVYEVKTFYKNFIELVQPPTNLQPGFLSVDYYFAPVVKVLHRDLESSNEKDKIGQDLPMGTVFFSIDGYWEIAEGDLITLSITEYFKNQVIARSETGIDSLWEFDVTRVVDDIISASGQIYKKDIDFHLQNYRNIVWHENSPNIGEAYTVRYAYNPTYIIFRQQPSPNALQNKVFPKGFYAHIFSKFNRVSYQNIKNKTEPTFFELSQSMKENLQFQMLGIDE
jgi:hypothetical protein